MSMNWDWGLIPHALSLYPLSVGCNRSLINGATNKPIRIPGDTARGKALKMRSALLDKEIEEGEEGITSEELFKSLVQEEHARHCA